MSTTARYGIKDLPTIGYWSALGGLEVKKIEYGIEDYILCVSGVWSSRPSEHRVKIHYERTRPYIIVYSQMHYLDECIRCS